jgi:hypothetical protein
MVIHAFAYDITLPQRCGTMRATPVFSFPLAAWLACLLPHPATAGTTVFIDPSQVATLVATNTASDTISSEGYLFTYTRDKLFTGGGGSPIGRAVRIPWPDGVEAQYVTAGPSPGNAKITIRRVDGAIFALTSFTAHLLANAGAGRAIEIVPLLNGEEPLNDPLYFDVSGNYGNQFSYDTSPNYLGSTATLRNYDTYVINLTLDYALTALTLESAAPNVNHAPADIALSNVSVLENEPDGTLIGTLDTADPDVGDTFTYALTAGTGGADNALFFISGSDLFAAATFNYEVRTNYSIRLESTDQGLLSTQNVFAINVVDVDETPVLNGLVWPSSSNIAISWSSVTNHIYTLHYSTNLVTGFSVLESNIPAAQGINSYTDSVLNDPCKFWKVSTVP